MNQELAKELLGQCRYDPTAGRMYDLMRCGFVWRDEFPPRDTLGYLRAIELLVPVVAYRGSLTRRSPLPSMEQSWWDLKSAVPGWPGFRIERLYGQVERDLRAASLREDRCLTKWEREELSDGI